MVLRPSFYCGGSPVSWQPFPRLLTLACGGINEGERAVAATTKTNTTAEAEEEEEEEARGEPEESQEETTTAKTWRLIGKYELGYRFQSY